jgi:predicted RNase H-like HicB family nuclease
MNRKVSIVIEKDENGYYAYCPKLPGCQTQSDTFEEINANIKEAVELYIETLSLEEVEPYRVLWSPNRKTLAHGNLVTSKSKGLDSKKQ